MPPPQNRGSWQVAKGHQPSKGARNLGRIVTQISSVSNSNSDLQDKAIQRLVDECNKWRIKYDAKVE